MVEKASYSDHLVQESFTKAIPDFLSKPDLPHSIVLVKNYLRQYFVYCCSKMKESSEKDLARKVLRDKFGFTPLILFSENDLDSFNKVIKIED